MKYIYYPGCSLKSTGKLYEESLLAVFDALGIEYEELNDWNCCGATAYMAVDEKKAFVLAARNLALAEQQMKDEKEVNIVAPCSACYMILLKTQKYLEDNPEDMAVIKAALKESGLEYNAKAKVRHPIDVLINDLGEKEISKRITKPLKGIRVASYYGCQTVRPYSTFDDQRNPVAMDNLFKAAGAEVVDWSMKTRCCGASLTGTIQEVALPLSYIILHEAKKRRADVVTTACSLCQFNLECYQTNIDKKFKTDTKIDVIYFTQLLGLALGIEPKKLGMNRLFSQPEDLYRIMEGGKPVYV
ncbi:MAG TPA: CoB--CoM heterodisulfide reductase iron-sulfur subunit B family protein [Ignavibacteria bacterium]|nr:CoB--CoM heterodisulfide reductase iron-sulfur subunit B family protein [Ignavibacteria bacterium]